MARTLAAVTVGACTVLATIGSAHGQLCSAPGTVSTACSGNCAILKVGDVPAQKGGTASIPISFTQGPDDSQAGQGFDDVSAIALTLGIPGDGSSTPLSFDCTDGDLAEGAVTVGPAIASNFTVVIENAQCTNRNRCLCPDTGAGQTRDNFVNVVVYGPKTLPEQGPVQIPILPKGTETTLVTLNMRVADDAASGEVPLHVFSAIGNPAKPQFGANLSVGDQAACDVTANVQNRSNVMIDDGVLTIGADVTPSPKPAVCTGDCGADGSVTINELILGVNIALGFQPLSACPAFDTTPTDQMVAINELVAAVNAALNGCP